MSYAQITASHNPSLPLGCSASAFDAHAVGSRHQLEQDRVALARAWAQAVRSYHSRPSGRTVAGVIGLCLLVCGRVHRLAERSLPSLAEAQALSDACRSLVSLLFVDQDASAVRASCNVRLDWNGNRPTQAVGDARTSLVGRDRRWGGVKSSDAQNGAMRFRQTGPQRGTWMIATKRIR